MLQAAVSRIISLTALVFLTLPLAGPLHAQNYYASPSGNDLNDCLTPQTPCRNGQSAIDRMPLGGNRLFLAAGAYPETLNVYHGRQVAVAGPINPGNECPNANAATVSTIQVQDNATIWVNCLTTGMISCRQWTTVDAADIVFDGTQAIALSSNETCRINTDRKLWINGPIVAFATASNYSTVYIGSEVIVSLPNLMLAYFVRAEDATINLSHATFSGYPLGAGLRFVLDNSTIVFPAAGSSAIPGSGSTSVNNSRCRPCSP